MYLLLYIEIIVIVFLIHFNYRNNSHYNVQLLSFENRLMKIKDNNNDLFNNLITLLHYTALPPPNNSY